MRLEKEIGNTGLLSELVNLPTSSRALIYYYRIISIFLKILMGRRGGGGKEGGYLSRSVSSDVSAFKILNPRNESKPAPFVSIFYIANYQLRFSCFHNVKLNLNQ